MSGHNYHFEDNGKFYKRTKARDGSDLICQVEQCRCGDWISVQLIKTPHHLGRKHHRAWAIENGEALVEPYSKGSASKTEDDTASDVDETSKSHWLLHIGDGVHFANSSKNNVWGVNSHFGNTKHFLSNVKKGDKLWFVVNKSHGLLVSVATFESVQKREVGPLIALTATNDELGWTEQEGEWDTEVLFKQQYDIRALDLLSEIKGAAIIRLYNEKCKVNLPAEYEQIMRYSKVVALTKKNLN